MGVGAQVLAAVDGVGGQRVVDALADIAPALAHHVVSFGFGEEAITHTAVYCGFPKALNAIFVAKRVAERDTLPVTASAA